MKKKLEIKQFIFAIPNSTIIFYNKIFLAIFFCIENIKKVKIFTDEKSNKFKKNGS